MNTRGCKNIFLLVFLISIVFVSYTELNNNLKIIKMEYIRKQTTETKLNGQEVDNIIVEEIEIDIDKSKEQNNLLLAQNELMVNNGKWRPIERKDSYNNELQYYSIDNVVFDGDSINITSRKETIFDKNYTSGMVESTYSYKYGFYEFLIEISEGKGLFPAIWLLPEAGNPLPEIDIFEMVGNKPYRFYGVIHFENNGMLDTEYFSHDVPINYQYTVSLEWHANSLTWFIDDEEVYTTTTQAVPNEFMYIIINQAIGGNWPGNPNIDTIFPSEFKIISTRIEPIFKRARY